MTDVAEIARGLSKAQREALAFLRRTALIGLRPGHNLWPETIIEDAGREIEGTDVDALHRLGLANASLSKQPAIIGQHDDTEIGEVMAEWDWKLTLDGLAVAAHLKDKGTDHG